MLILTRAVNSAIILSNVYDENGNCLEDIEINIFKDNRIGIKADKSIDIVRAETLQAEPD
ncbi:carbon storage regulator [Shewanella youngdeokensis]|uniref:Carbon storage regulator n=1 Tax=Shewanella youngdeokensis TaxID=2999068 RepID=A0ABZ0JX52_9GAMM|nr:carbon storage regulator [Shewanella sp. DAU334]